jgi:hypothetical protein
MTAAQDAPSYTAVYAERFPQIDSLGLIYQTDVQDDPGAELVDIGDLGMTDLDVTPTLMAAPALVSMANRQALAADYEWATWLADVLRAVGCSVVEYPGWKTRGRPRSAGRFQPRGVIWHHDASAKGPSPYVAKFCAEQGRPDEGIPAPLAQCWVCMGCKGAHPVGTWHILAAGRANHAGTGRGWGGFPKDSGNAAAIGVETDNTTGEPTPADMLRSLVSGTAAIMRRLRANPGTMLAGHKEYALGRKTDPDDINMSTARGEVADEMVRQAQPGATPKPPTKPTPKPPAKPSKPAPRPVPAAPALVKFPGAAVFTKGRKSTYTKLLGDWLIKAGYGKHGNKNGYQSGPTFTEYDRLNVAAFQRSRPALRGDADGYPGPKTWELLQAAARGK